MRRYTESYSEEQYRKTWEFAHQHLSKWQCDRLDKSSVQQVKAQIDFFIVPLVIIVLELIFVPGPLLSDESNMFSTLKMGIIMLTVGFSVLPVFPIWAVLIAPHFYGKLWISYCKWYKRWHKNKASMDELYQLFN